MPKICASTCVAILLGSSLALLTSAPALTQAPQLDAEDSTILHRPFTADEIRGEWTQGLVLTLLFKSPQGEERQRWTVVSADTEGCDIEYASLDAEGEVSGEPSVGHATWIELRNHATFKADLATRQDVTRKTDLGELAGWLYTVRDPEAGSVTEYFFASSLPGAPVYLRVRKDGKTVSEMTQLKRQH
jgi:hypothetical protein